MNQDKKIKSILAMRKRAWLKQMSKKKSGVPKSSFSQKVLKADDLFRKIIHKAYKDQKKCWCGRTFKSFNSQVAHGIKRRYNVVRWEFKNAALMCEVCNNADVPMQDIIDKVHGPGTYAALEDLAHKYLEKIDIDAVIENLEKQLKP